MPDSVLKINDLGVGIAIATEQQSAATEEVNGNMAAIQEVVNDLTNSSVQKMDNAQSLASSNEQLAAIVKQFKLK